MAKVVLPRSLQRLLVHLFVGLFRGNYFFVHGQEKKEGGDGLGLDLWVELCTPPKYWHSTSPVLVETKVLNPVQTLTFQPGCFIAGPTVVCARSSQITVNCLHFHSLMGSLRRKVVNGRSVNTLTNDNSCFLSIVNVPPFLTSKA